MFGKVTLRKTTKQKNDHNINLGSICEKSYNELLTNVLNVLNNGYHNLIIEL